MFGRCHLCKIETAIAWCYSCEHWFCQKCKNRWFRRGLAFVKQLTGGKVDGCCGPKESKPCSKQSS